jgi:uncharacterized protein (DUF1800 family)
MAPTSHVALHRLGFGARPDQAPPADPLAWADAQTRGPGPALAPPEGRDAPFTLADGYAAWRQHDAAPPGPGQRSPVTVLYQAERAAWVRHLLTSAEGFRDRITAFWLNHFTVAERAGFGVQSAMSPFLRDAVRANQNGRFVDLLLAVERAPAMIQYLDQNASVGPNSPFGRRSGRGLNENLAREILELHTLTPAGGYTQADVTEFARLMSGWTISRQQEPLGLVFRAGSHEPGEKTVLGTRYAEGPDAYEQVLRRLAAHPATLRHVATRLVRHFSADAPPPAAVARIERLLRETEGDLSAAYRALLRLPETWAPHSKLRTPQEYVLAMFRAGGGTDPNPLVGAMSALGQPMWNAPQPNGWPDVAAGWMGPEPAMQRLDLAYETAGRFARQDPRRLAEVALGPLARDDTRQAMARAGSARDANARIFASPEMQRR